VLAVLKQHTESLLAAQAAAAMLNYACEAGEAGDGYTVIWRVCGGGGGTEKASKTVELRNRRQRWPTSGDPLMTPRTGVRCSHM